VADEKGFRWPVPKNSAEAVRRWGKAGTVSIDALKLRTGMQVLMTFERPKKEKGEDPYFFNSTGNLDRYVRALTEFEVNGRVVEPTGIRLSGHPEALRALFRALHIEYTKKQERGKAPVKKNRRTIIMDKEED
jgi:hypothetical protein